MSGTRAHVPKALVLGACLVPLVAVDRVIAGPTGVDFDKYWSTVHHFLFTQARYPLLGGFDLTDHRGTEWRSSPFVTTYVDGFSSDTFDIVGKHWHVQAPHGEQENLFKFRWSVHVDSSRYSSGDKKFGPYRGIRPHEGHYDVFRAEAEFEIHVYLDSSIISYSLLVSGNHLESLVYVIIDATFDDFPLPPLRGVPDSQGGVSMTFNPLDGQFSLSALIAGLAPTDIIASSIHVGAPEDVGPLIVDLGDGSAWLDLSDPNGTGAGRELLPVPFPPAHQTDLLAGNTYLAIYTLAEPFGALRAQLVPAPPYTPPTPLSAASRKPHGGSGNFDLPLPLGAGQCARFEPRSGGPTRIVVAFDEPIEIAGAALPEQLVTASGAQLLDATVQDSELRIDLLPTASCIGLTIAGLADSEGNLLLDEIQLQIGALVGDVDDDGQVTNLDVAAISDRLGQSADSTNFQFDLNADGLITLDDAALAGAQLGANASCLLGDVDCDRIVDFFDIDVFVSRLGCPGAGPGCSDGCPWQNADANQDGEVDFFDIDPFVALLGTTCP